MNKSLYQEQVLDLINRRSLALHKASSIRHTLLPDEREHKKAYLEGVAAHIKTDLINLVVEQYPDKRPEPAAEFEYNGERMVIQRHDGVNTWYVKESKFDPELYEYIRTDYRTHIIREISRH